MRAYAAVIDEKGGRFRLEDLQLDGHARPRLVRAVACGFCQADLHGRDQDYPFRSPFCSVTKARVSWKALARVSAPSSRATSW